MHLCHGLWGSPAFFFCVCVHSSCAGLRSICHRGLLRKICKREGGCQVIGWSMHLKNHHRNCGSMCVSRGTWCSTVALPEGQGWSSCRARRLLLLCALGSSANLEKGLFVGTVVPCGSMVFSVLWGTAADRSEGKVVACTWAQVLVYSICMWGDFLPKVPCGPCYQQ